MKMMLDWQNISRQGAHQGIACMHAHHRDLLQTVELASQVRADHPQIGCRDIYYTLPNDSSRKGQLKVKFQFRTHCVRNSFSL